MNFVHTTKYNRMFFKFNKVYLAVDTKCLQVLFQSCTMPVTEKYPSD